MDCCATQPFFRVFPAMLDRCYPVNTSEVSEEVAAVFNVESRQNPADDEVCGFLFLRLSFSGKRFMNVRIVRVQLLSGITQRGNSALPL
jgi:hypothetical protein